VQAGSETSAKEGTKSVVEFGADGYKCLEGSRLRWDHIINFLARKEERKEN